MRLMLMLAFVFLLQSGLAETGKAESVVVKTTGRAIVGMTTAELKELTDALPALLPNEVRVLAITIQSGSKATVRTGKIDGPLSGGGEMYELSKKDGRWIISGRYNWIS
ncbi:MAG: hypothetical protein M9935_01020 [Kiritimatiellae bacterium]|nr:hypothetical protein [Kiritimatiellia bacterium]